ncbi:hypothetical protein F5X99DRAFT_414868 [Biscogniauxia marginata]|nr:hypothetical protein F5X99DRAFT_414868 [Biscogniauxia marginata]
MDTTRSLWEKVSPDCRVDCPDMDEWDQELGETDLGDPGEWSDDEEKADFPQYLVNWLGIKAANLPRMKAPPVNTLGMSSPTSGFCVITDSMKVPGTAVAVTTPSYVGGQAMLAYENSGSVTGSLDVFSRWLKTTEDGNCYFSLTYVAATQVLSDLASATATLTGSKGMPRGNTPPMDHIYENNLIHRFAGSFIDANAPFILSTPGPVDKLNCEDFLYLMYGGSAGKRTRNYLTRIADSLIGWNNLQDMCGMYAHANTWVKVSYSHLYQFVYHDNTSQSLVMTVPRLQNDLDRILGSDRMGASVDPWDDQPGRTGLKNKLRMKLKYWKQIDHGIRLMNFMEILLATQRTNIRIYNAWPQNDQDLACEQAYLDNKWSFAPKYKAFIESHFNFLTDANLLSQKMRLLAVSVYHDSVAAVDMKNIGRSKRYTTGYVGKPIRSILPLIIGDGRSNGTGQPASFGTRPQYAL